MKTSSRKLVALLAMAILLAASVRVALWGLADIDGLTARYTLAQWDKTRLVPASAALTSAENALSVALRFDGENADILDDLGRLAELKAFQSPTRDEARTESLRALDYYRQSVMRRPTWPYTWANIAGAKLRLGELDREFHLAIERAVKFGPWEPAVQIAVADVGLAAWNDLPGPVRGIVVTNLKRGLQRQTVPIMRVAQRYGRTDVLLTDTPGLNARP